MLPPRLRLLMLLGTTLAIVGIGCFLGPDLGRLVFRPPAPEPADFSPAKLFPGTGRVPTAADFAPTKVLEQQAAITDLKVIAAEQVTHEVTSDELVLGVVIDGQSRAYPINVLTTPQRKVFNDVLADQPIAATW